MSNLTLPQRKSACKLYLKIFIIKLNEVLTTLKFYTVLILICDIILVFELKHDWIGGNTFAIQILKL